MPLFYRVGACLFTQSPIEVVGAGTSGEAELVMIDDGTELFLGLDMCLEIYDPVLDQSIAHDYEAIALPTVA